MKSILIFFFRNSMSKRKPTELIGYVVGVSPQKLNKTFHVQIQTDADSVKKAMCFDPVKHETFALKKLSGDPVKIKSIFFQEGNTSKGFASYVINKETQICNIDPNNVQFSLVDPPQETFVDFSSQFIVGTLVSAKAQLDLSHSQERSVYVGNGRRKCEVLNNAFLYNTSGEIALTIWEEWIPFFKSHVQAGSNYFEIKNLLVREFNNEMSLSTCSDTSCTVLIEDPPSTTYEVRERKIIHTVSSFDSVSVQYIYICGACSRNIKATTKSERIECSSCETKSKTATLEKKVLVKVKSAEISEDFYVIDGNGLKEHITLDPTSFDTDKDDLIDAIMDLKEVTVYVDKISNVISMT